MIMNRTNVFALFALTFTLAANYVITQPTGVPPKTRVFDFTYSAEIRTLPQGSHDVSMWIPLPRGRCKPGYLWIERQLVFFNAAGCTQ